MKFIVSTSALSKHLQAVSGALSSNNTLPILDNFLFDIKSGKLKIIATDLHCSMTTTLDVESKEDGMIAVPSRILLDTIKTFPEQPIVFDVNTEKFSVEISNDSGKYKLQGENPEDYPKLPEQENVHHVDINCSVLTDAINKSLFAVSNDDLRLAMTGVYTQLSPDGIIFVATDAHKLVKYTRKDTKAAESASIILPKKALNLLKQGLPDEDVNVTVSFNQTHAFFSVKNIQIICRLIDEKYPDYEAVIPKNNPNKLTIDRVTFLNVLKRVSIFANKTTHQVRLKFSGSELQISAEDVDFSSEAFERLACDYSGEDLEIGFNARFMVEMLSNLDSKQVQMEMSTPSRAGIIIPASDDDQEEVLMLVMPVMLNNPVMA
jgi:DNA polymerase-3 subunit beta